MVANCIIKNGIKKEKMNKEIIKNIKEYKVRALKSLCKFHKIKCSGLKQVIYDRLSKYLKETAAAATLQKFCKRILYRIFIF